MSTPAPNTMLNHFTGFRRTIIALVLFGIAFGYVEAATVVYLRAIYEPMRYRVYPETSQDALFPLLRFEDIEAEGPEHVRRLATEVIREAATLVMLTGIGLAVGRTFLQWIAVVMISFGLWDIFYYVFLKWLINWPASLFTWDILFLLPVPWVGPVIAPSLVALSMIVAGVVMLARESVGRPVPLGVIHWCTIVLGGVLIVVAFCWDWRNIIAGGEPNPFNWSLFTIGEVVGVLAFLHAIFRGGKWNQAHRFNRST